MPNANALRAIRALERDGKRLATRKPQLPVAEFLELDGISAPAAILFDAADVIPSYVRPFTLLPFSNSRASSKR